jgi:hypothetical protein
MYLAHNTNGLNFARFFGVFCQTVKYSMTTTWTWRTATGSDVADIVAMAQQDFESEIDAIFQPDPVAYARNITQAVVTQFYQPDQCLLLVAYSPDNHLVAYTWARPESAPWSDDRMATVQMAHIDLTLPVRARIRLVQEMIGFWETWAVESAIPIVCSVTMRRDTTGFLRIHAARGYDVRGSIAYKRLK